ncbi:MAG TPA: LLM class F420-dependent oxidoreductase [Acidimicrobiaceae bacterium]|nr:LLM class F420-dependent oxidoreductase [Acidimicrobiaceae bacterium]
MKIAVMPPAREGVTSDPQWVRSYARHAERCGFEAFVAIEHPLVVSSYTSRYPYDDSGRMPLPDDTPIPDPLDLLSFVAGSTTTLGLCTGVLVLPAHHPVTLAKRLATLDVLSGGRLRLCVGLGWMREELEACGTDFATRGRRADEMIDAMRALWEATGPEGAHFAGEFFAFADAHSYPKPVHRGGIPIHIGGTSRASMRRAATRGDGWQPLGIGGDELRVAIADMRKQVEAEGRDPSGFEITVSGVAPKITAETVGKVAAMGIDRVIASGVAPGLDDALEELSALAERVGLPA